MTTLIPRDALFGNPERGGARVSPDGRSIVYLAPYDGKLSVWTATIGADDARVVAHDPKRPIPWADWQGDGRHVLYLQDAGGNENYHLYHVDPATGAARDCTPGENVRAVPLTIDHRFPTEMLVTSNARDPKVYDVVRLDFAAEIAAIDTENPGDVVKWLCDRSLTVRAAVAKGQRDASILRVRDDATSPWRDVETYSSADGAPTLVAFSPDGASLTLITAKDANTSRLVRYDLATGARTVLYEDPTYDASIVLGAQPYVDPATGVLFALPILRERLSWHAIAPEFAADLDALATIGRGEVLIESADGAGETLIVLHRVDDGPNAVYAYRRSTREATLLFHTRPALLEYTLAQMQPVHFPARDGRVLHGYLTLPRDVPPRDLPTVLYVHGGPWVRDRWGFEPFVQWFANRGYAVLQVNYRGSTGYGKDFRNAGNREWAGAMRTDLLDARDWAIAQGIADARRFGIFGGSYGGYAVLAALAFSPDAFTCGVDLCGVSNLNTFLGSIPPYWSQMLATLHERVGEDPAFLAAQSPLHRAADIRAPLLIAQGANDPRVKQAESEQIVAALRANDIAVTYIVFENEGHGFANPANNLRFVAASEVFLATHLGGRVDPPLPSEAIDAYLR